VKLAVASSRPQVLSVREVQAILDACRHLRDRLQFGVLLHTGIHLWGRPLGRPLTYAAVYDLVGRLQRATGVAFGPHPFRQTFVTTMLDAGVDLRDVQIAARHADPRTTMRYDRARNQLDRHPNYILAVHMASGT
jgi:site-specific recombinase XerC